MKILISLSLLLLSTVLVKSQDIYVFGNDTKEPIDKVQVDIVGKRIHTQYTNDQGFLSLKGTEKNDTLILNHISYERLKIAINDLNSSNSIIYLKHEAISYPEIDIIMPRNKSISTPQTVRSLLQKEILYDNAANSAALLEATGQVLIQKSQQGGGSPIIRGFEANRVLLVVDGVRMNNAIYRSGHLQNAISIDNNILQEAEVIFGTSSLIYGSDALGGVIHYKTINPKFSNETKYKLGLSLKYASAASENTTHGDLQIMGKKLSSLSSFTYSDFGDLKMGSIRDHGDDNWGLVTEYTETINGKDTVLTNNDPKIQKHSSYSQYDFLQKLLFKVNDKLIIKANAQYSTSSDVPRFDRYNDYKDGQLKYAIWDYGPQSRLLLSIGADITSDRKLINKANITLAYQKIDEDRYTRRFDSLDLYSRMEDVKVLSLNMDVVKKISTSKRLFYGAELTSNDVQSTATLENPIVLSTASATRYPDGGSTLSSAAAYISFISSFHKKWDFNLGLRYSVISAKSSFKNEYYSIELPFSDISFTTGAPTLSTGLKYTPNGKTKIRLLASTGFRAPNIDDYGKVFERDNYVVVPNNELDPEYAINGELGIRKEFLNKKISLDASFYYTHILDAIVRRDYQLNGEDSIMYEGSQVKIQSNQNTGEARVYGYSIGLGIKIKDNWNFKTTANYNIGDDISGDAPLAHIPPFFLRGELTYDKNNLRSSIYINYHDLKSKNSIAPGRTDNAKEGLNGVFPSWYTLNYKIMYNITNTVSAQIAIENILDKHYKSFASGISAPGRNIVLSVRANIN